MLAIAVATLYNCVGYSKINELFQQLKFKNHRYFVDEFANKKKLCKIEYHEGKNSSV